MTEDAPKEITPSEGAQPAENRQDTPAPAEPPQAAQPAPGTTAPPAAPGKVYVWGTGRRKSAVARVRIRPGSGNILINKRELDTYFHADKDRNAVLSALKTVDMTKAWDVWANVRGGGFTGQAGAVTLGLARALVKAVPEVEHDLRSHGLLTRDARMKERKKYGQKGARKRFQFSKR